MLGLEGREAVADAGQLVDRVHRPHQDIAGRGAVLRHVVLRDERAERVPQHDRPLEAELCDHRLDVVGHLRHRPERRIAGIGAAVGAVVDGE